MNIKKIKAVKCGFADGCGPYETITLGLTVDGCDFIFGNFYFGPGMTDSHDKIYRKTESAIDNLVQLSDKNEQE